MFIKIYKLIIFCYRVLLEILAVLVSMGCLAVMEQRYVY